MCKEILNILLKYKIFYGSFEKFSYILEGIWDSIAIFFTVFVFFFTKLYVAKN